MRGTALLLALLPTPALACDFCSSSAVMTSERALCFEQIVEERLRRLRLSGRGFVQVDLDSCAKAQGSEYTRSTVGTGLNDPSLAYAEGANLFLEEGQISCLRAMIANAASEFDPELLVQLPSDC